MIRGRSWRAIDGERKLGKREREGGEYLRRVLILPARWL